MSTSLSDWLLVDADDKPIDAHKSTFKIGAHIRDAEAALLQALRSHQDEEPSNNNNKNNNNNNLAELLYHMYYLVTDLVGFGGLLVCMLQRRI